MIRTNTIYQAGLSLTEQFISSGSNFIFFLLLARHLGPESYGVFGVSWVLIQFCFGVNSAVSTVPLSAYKTAQGDEKFVIAHSMWRLGQCGICSIGFILLFFKFVTDTGSVSQILVTGFCCVLLCCFDFCRRYTIRLGRYYQSVFLIVARWLITFGLFFSFKTTNYSFGPDQALFLISIGLTPSLVLFAREVLAIRPLQNRPPPNLSSEINKLTIPVSVDNMTAALNAVTMAFLVPGLIGHSAYGYYIAIVSICNGFSVLGQIIDIHFSSLLLKRDLSPSRIKRIIYSFIFLLGCLCALVICYKDLIVLFLLGQKYSSCSELLPIIFLQNCFLIIAQLGTTILRSFSKNSIYYARTFTRFFGFSFLLVTMLMGANLVTIAGVAALSSFFQLVVVLIFLKGLLSKQDYFQGGVY